MKKSELCRKTSIIPRLSAWRKAWSGVVCLLLFSLLTFFSSCITEDAPVDTKRGNFESLWKTLDERYCFFDQKKAEFGLDWDEVYSRYSPQINEGISREQLFEVLGGMVKELRDGHVNLYASFNVARYAEWYDAYPMNFSDSLERRYLGTNEDFYMASGLKYRVLDDNVGYVRCPSFDTEFGDGNLQEMIRKLMVCDALIVDVRSNGGGKLTSAQKLASLFVNETTVGGYISHKTGPGHSDFSTPKPVEIKPFGGLRWQKPLFILTNRRTYSAANSFVVYLKGLPGVCVVGDRTGGGSGMPFSSELPGGWSLRFSASPLYDRDKVSADSGIDPDVKVDISEEDYARSVDTIIETARRLSHTAAR